MKNKFLNRSLYTNRKLILFLVAVIAIPLVILGTIIIIQQTNPYRNAVLVADKQIFNSYESPKFRIYINKNDENISYIGKAFAATEPKIEAKVIGKEKVMEEYKTVVEKESEDVYMVYLDSVMELTPGEFTLEAKISNSTRSKTLSQNFTWGVLAMNPNKATYKPGETSEISIGVIDETGAMVCDADLTLEVKGPNGSAKTLTSKNKEIKVHPQCESYEYSEEPDITSSFEVDEIGEYTLNLTAVTKNGTYSIEDYINVAEDVPFEIERKAVTRIYPLNEYPMRITIKANEDFRGEIIEHVPSSYGIMESHQEEKETDYAAFTVNKGIVKTISWDVDMKKGETYEFDYVYDAPDKSPYFFLMGNLEFVQGEVETGIVDKVLRREDAKKAEEGRVVYSEGRFWQIAVDIVCGFGTDIGGGVCRGYLTSGTSWSVPTDWDSTNAVIECVGPGGDGAIPAGSSGGGGGQGGGYGRVATPSAIAASDNLTIQVGLGGSTNATYLQDNTSTTICQGDYGASAVDDEGGTRSQTNTGAAATASGGAGGGGGGGYGASGGGGAGGTNGNGAAGGSSANYGGGGGGGSGGGSAGSNDNNEDGGNGGASYNSVTSGGTGATSCSPADGGDGGGDSGGASGGGGGFRDEAGDTCTGSGGAGGSGQEWDSTHGTGAGGGGGGGDNDNKTSINAGDGGAGGSYGGGGGGGGRSRSASDGAAGSGGDGIIVITYTPPVTEINVSGNVYNAGTSTALTECDASAATHELSLRADGTTYTTSCSNSDGSFTFSTVDVSSLGAGGGMVIWIDDAEAPETDGAMVVRWDGDGDSTSNTFYDDTVTITSDDTNPVDNADMDVYDADGGDVDIPYVVTSSNLVASDSAEVLVKIKSGVTAGSDVFDPGGTVTTNATGGDFHIDDNSDAFLDTATNSIGGDILIDTGATLTISGNTTVDGGDITATGTLATSGTPTVTMRGTGNISGAGTKTIYNLNIGDATAATITLTGDLTVSNNVTVDTGDTFNINADLTVTGSLANTTTGVINHTANSPIVSVAGSTVGGGSGNLTFYRLQTSGTTSFSGSGTNTINNTLDATGGTLTISDTVTIAGDVSASNAATLNQNAAMTINGGDLLTSGTGVINTTAGTATVTINGSGGTIGGGGTVTVYDLDLGGTGTQTLASALTVSNDIDIPTGKTLALDDQNVNVNGGDIITAGTAAITCAGCSTSTVTMSGTGNIGGGTSTGAITFYNLATTGTGTTTFQNDGTNTVSNNITVDTGTTLNINDNISVAGAFTNTTTGIIGYSAGTPTVTMTGTGSLGGGSGAITFYDLATSGTGTITFSGSGTNTVDNDVSVGTATTLNINDNLTVSGGDLASTGTGVIGTTAGTGVVTISGTGNIGGGGSITLYGLSVGGTQTLQSAFTAGAGGIAVTTGNTLALNDQTVQSGAALSTAGTGTITCSGCTTGTVTLTGTGNIGGGGTVTVYNLTKSTGGTNTVAGTTSILNDLNVSAGTLNGTGSMTVGSSGVANSGDISIAGTLNMTGGTITAQSSSGGTATIGGAGGITFYNLTFGPAVASAPTYTLGSAGSQTINVSNDLTIGNGSNGVTVTANTNDPVINVDGSFSVSANGGSFTAPPTSNFTVAANFTNNGTFNANGGEVIFDTTTNSIIDGSGTPAVVFQDFTSTTGNKVIDFTQSKTFEIDGVFTITGSASNLIGITSTTSTQWLLDLDGSASFSYADISNSGCASGSLTVNAGATSNNGGNNDTCWFFPNTGKATFQGGTTIRGGTTIKDVNP